MIRIFKKEKFKVGVTAHEDGSSGEQILAGLPLN